MELKSAAAVLLICASTYSCMKEEIPVEAPDAGMVFSDTVGIGGDYRYQVYYSLRKGEQVGRNLKSQWDIGFECSNSGRTIILNSSKLMFAAKTSASEFDKITYTWVFLCTADGVTGHTDSMALKDWQEGNYIYVIDRGYDEGGIHQGFVKVLFVAAGEEDFTIHWCALEESVSKEVKITKNPAVNYTFYSFIGAGSQVSLEPPKETWDLLFTQYTESLNDEGVLVPYIVTGVQINRSATLAGRLEGLEFSSITRQEAALSELTANISQPGYLWKTYDFGDGLYRVDPSMIFIIQSSEGYYFKLRFTDFYNASGDKGYPRFEYQQL